MKFYFFIPRILMTFIFLTFSPSFLKADAFNPSAKTQVVKKISEVIHPSMGEIWATFFSNFEEDKILSWDFSNKTGFFSITLKQPLKFWIPASKSASSEPRPGSILIFGAGNKVMGRLNPELKKIEFTQGFKIFCKYKFGFFTVPIMVDVYSFTYKNNEQIILEAGKAGVAEKRSKTLEKYLNAWGNKNHVVTGDYEAFLNQQSK